MNEPKLRKIPASSDSKQKKSFPAGTFFICFAIGVLSWLLTAFEKTYSYRTKIPVVFENIPHEKLLTHKLPETVVADVSGNGFSLISLYFKTKSRLLNVNLADLNPGITFLTRNELKIPISGFLGSEIEKINSDIKVASVSPDTLTLNFSERTSKKVPVLLRCKISFAPNCDTTAPAKITPDSVTVFGPSASLDTLAGIPTEQVNFKKLHQSATLVAKLILPEGFSSDLLNVEVMIPVEKFTEKEIDSPVEITNVPTGISVKLIPSKVKIMYLVSLSKYNEDKNITATVDFSETKNLNTGSIQLKYFAVRSGIKNVRILPDKVMFLKIK